MKKSRNNHLKIGKLGEDIACKFFKKKGFEIFERNYNKKWGEIDIIAKKCNIIHFIEVKTVSREIIKKRDSIGSYENEDFFQPEDAVHTWKIKRLSRAIQSYLLERNVSDETEWQFDLIAVFLDVKRKRAKVRLTEDMGLS